LVKEQAKEFMPMKKKLETGYALISAIKSKRYGLLI
jgi:hypothetical protein